MKNISVPVDGIDVAFDDDGTMRYIAMKVVNMDEGYRWQEVDRVHVSVDRCRSLLASIPRFVQPEFHLARHVTSRVSE